MLIRHLRASMGACSTLVCEYLSGSQGTLHMAPRSCSALHGMMPLIINHIMSYTCMKNLMIVHQSTGTSHGSIVNTSVYDKLIILKMKHYIGVCLDGTKQSKGVSYVWRSGAVLNAHSLETFINVVACHTSTQDIVSHMQIEYDVMKHTVVAMSNIEMLHIRASIRGVTSLYIKVLSDSTPYVDEFKFDTSTHTVNLAYYTRILDSTLLSVCMATGIHVITCITLQRRMAQS